MLTRMKSFVAAVLIALVLAAPAQAAVKTLRADLIGTWNDFFTGEQKFILNGSGTGTWESGADVTWTYSKGELSLYDSARNTTYTFEIISESRAMITLQFTSADGRYWVLELDKSRDDRCNFATSDLINTFEYEQEDGTKVNYTFFADGYGLEDTGSSSSSSGTPFTWTYENPILTITGYNNYTYELVLFADDYLTLYSQDGEIVLWKQK
ncbi:MAG: hypothetical protein JRJ59_00995 [Deltaproteobacteria bacterium]|nr:hypothetical protein [Deltaproteobacteria bacterium]